MSNIVPFLATFGGFASVAVAANSVMTDLESRLPQSAAGHEPIPAETQSILVPTLTATGEFWSNQHGGAQTGSRWNTLVDAGITIDLERLGAPHGSQLVGQFFWVKNQDNETNMCSLTGAFNPVSGLQAGDQTRVFNLHYRQSWNDDAYVVKLGQLAIDDDFMTSSYAGLFINSAFGAMPSQVATPLAATANNTAAFPIYAVAAPGIFFSAKTSEAFSWQLGVYHGGPGPDEKQNHGFDWESGSVAGPVAFLENSWKSKVGKHTSTFRLGAAYHTGEFDNFEALNAGESDTTTRGLYSFYTGQDLALDSNEKGESAFGVFWRAGISPQQDRSVVKTYADIGVSWFGPFASRPDDVAGVALSWTELGREFRTYCGGDVLARHQTTLEFTYRAQLTSYWALQADLQLLGNTADELGTGSHPSATIVGLRTELSF